MSVWIDTCNSVVEDLNNVLSKLRTAGGKTRSSIKSSKPRQPKTYGREEYKTRLASVSYLPRRDRWSPPFWPGIYGLHTEHFGPFTHASCSGWYGLIAAPLLRVATLKQGEIMSHSDNIKFPWALVVLQNKQCKRLCVDWICPTNKSSDFNSLLYFLLALKLVLYGHQGHKQ